MKEIDKELPKSSVELKKKAGWSIVDTLLFSGIALAAFSTILWFIL